MKTRALVVPRAEGEATRRALAEAGLLRRDARIVARDDRLLLPLVDGRDPPTAWGTIVEEELDPRPPEGPRDYRELVAVPGEGREALPRSFDVVGDVVLVRLPPALRSRGAEVGDALLRFVPGARIVGADRGVHGAERLRSIDRLAGDGGWATVHRENGLSIEVDLERAYFSPRLALEHARVAAGVAAGDRVYDLCCGVGPFALHIARDGRARSVVAVDANPAAIELLRRSRERLDPRVPVEAVCERIESFLADRAPAEQVVLNLPHEGIKYVPSVARAVAPRGRLTYYEIASRTALAERGNVIAHTLGPRVPWTVRAARPVHPYAPGADLAAFVLERPEG